jgi:hypothetical protein
VLHGEIAAREQLVGHLRQQEGDRVAVHPLPVRIPVAQDAHRAVGFDPVLHRDKLVVHQRAQRREFNAFHGRRVLRQNLAQRHPDIHILFGPMLELYLNHPIGHAFLLVYKPFTLSVQPPARQVILPAMSEPFLPALSDYLRDESRRTGRADRIAFARTAEDVLAALAEARANRRPVTVQGARTGVTGGAVPEGGLVLNLSKMDRILAVGPGEMRVEPGATLAAIRAAVPPGFFFAPDPTEPTASIGGMISCNSSGALSFSHGPTRNHILGLRVATLSGDLLDLRRGRDRATACGSPLAPSPANSPPSPAPPSRTPRAISSTQTWIWSICSLAPKAPWALSSRPPCASCPPPAWSGD